MNPHQRRAVRNGVVGVVLTAALLLAIDAAVSTRSPSERTSPTPSPAVTPTECAPDTAVVRSQNPDAAGDQLLGVAAVAPDEAWAVGGVGDPAEPTSTLIERWDGKRWNLIDSPDGGQVVNVLQAVDATADNDAWAVGRSSDGSVDRPLIEHWDGTAWTLARSPTVAATAQLLGVAAVAADDAWAVGSVGDATTGTERALLLHWDGSSWVPVDVTGAVGGGRSLLAGVAAVTATDVWTAGYHHGLPLVMHFNGRRWTSADAPGRGELASVVAVSATDVWAVGASVLHYDGATWTEDGSVRRRGVLAGVAAAAPNDVWAVGSDAETGRGIVQHWEGRVWDIIATEGRTGALTAASALPDGTVWAVGYRETPRGRRTLVLEGGACATST